ncbi:MAG TPA: hypothetical protein PKZ43_07195 [Bacteroidales bacterium]|nr:hypothetical protein [Bacteroidales bacterium]
MEYNTDNSGNNFLEVPLGWDSINAKLRLTFIEDLATIRLNKIDENNHVYPGPEIELQYTTELIEALIKIYNDNKE